MSTMGLEEHRIGEEQVHRSSLSDNSTALIDRTANDCLRKERRANSKRANIYEMNFEAD